MSLTVTAGASDADSYASLADANAYFTARGVTAWTGTDDAKEAALRRATTYLDNQYRGRWVGVRYVETQALAWPRVDGSGGAEGRATCPLYDVDGFVIAYDAIPMQIKNATIEAALLIVGGSSLEPVLEHGGQIKSVGKSVGPLRKDIVYQDGASPVDRYVVIEGLLRGLVKSTPGASVSMVPLVRS